MNKEFGTTLIIVTHDPKIAKQTERVIELYDGSRERKEKEMNFTQSIREALESLTANKLRAAFTILRNCDWCRSGDSDAGGWHWRAGHRSGLDQRDRHQPVVCVPGQFPAGCAQ